MLQAILFVIIGFIFLIWGADRFVAGASALARNLGVSPLLVGLIIVGFGTSAPEMFVSGVAGLHGSTALGVGNAIGSNIINVGLVIGLTVLIKPLQVNSGILRREFPMLFIIMALVGVLLGNGYFSRMDGIILLVGFFLLFGWFVKLGLSSKEDEPLSKEFAEEIPTGMPTARAVFWVVLGLVLLIGSGEVLVQGAVFIAKALGVNNLIIGLTVVAVGTSLPELAASLMGALRNESDLALGNVLGSNMFNLLAVLGLPGAIHPATLSPLLMERDYPAMVILAVMLFVMSFAKKGKTRCIGRFSGVLLLLAFTAYFVMLFTAVS